MTRRRRTAKEAELVKLHLADIIQDVFDNDGQVVTHDQLAKRHVLRNGSVTAEEDVRLYGGPAVAYLRAAPHNYAIVPITGAFEDYTGDPTRESEIANSVAGLGGGGPRVGWYQPINANDWLWVYYVGHLGRAGISAVFHAARMIDTNPTLIDARGRTRLAAATVNGLPVPPGKTEAKLLASRLAVHR